jgi:hypothetical protein
MRRLRWDVLAVMGVDAGLWAAIIAGVVIWLT